VRRSLLALLLAGCTSTTIPLIQPNVPVATPPAQPMSLYSVKWQVMALPQLKNLVAQLEKAQQSNVVLFVLDQQNYTNLMLNFVEVQRYLQEQKTILDMLKTIIAERAADSAAKPK
jgi:type IV pilus biogenesis protein CpaD/CtpE